MVKEHIIDCVEEYFSEIDDFKTLDYEFVKLIETIGDIKVNRHNQLVKRDDLYRCIK